jgi:predicted O-methyltransferase YrrM
MRARRSDGCAGLLDHLVEFGLPWPPQKEMAFNTISRLFLYLRLKVFPLPETKEILQGIDEPFLSALLSLYAGEKQVGADGQTHAINTATRVSPWEGMWIYNLCRSLKPNQTLEIGMAYGFSALFFLAAIAKNKFGHHTAVDPVERSSWHGIGIETVRAIGMESEFSLIEDYSARAATDLARENRAFDLILIDGNHRFDDVLADFYLYAPLCKIGGQIILDDVWMKSIRTVVAFIRANRNDFAEVASSESNICVFQRIGGDTREWDHFRTFSVPRAT